MGLDDRGAWACASLLTDDDDGGGGRALWTLERGEAVDLKSGREFWEGKVGGKGYEGVVYDVLPGDGAWKWVLRGGAKVKNGVGREVVPLVRVLPEEPMLGYWERHLLALTRGLVDVWRFAEEESAGVEGAGDVV